MEIRDLYNEQRELTGETIEKGKIIPSGKYYITVMVWIQNSNGEILLQKTAPSKKHKWSTTGGHPVSGETSLEGIQTEIKEELGLDVDTRELILFKTVKTNDDFVDVYYLKKDINLNDVKIQFEELEEVKWFTKEQVNLLIVKKEFLLDHIKYFKYFIDYLDENN